VGATERLVLFPTWLLLDLLGVVTLSTFGYEQLEKTFCVFLKKTNRTTLTYSCQRNGQRNNEIIIIPLHLLFLYYFNLKVVIPTCLSKKSRKQWLIDLEGI